MWLEQQDDQLHARLTWIRHHVDVGDAAVEPQGDVARAAPARSGRPIRTQTVLLSIGALCLVLAAVVFVAVAWNRLSAIGQISALAVVVTALSVAAHALQSGYRSTAETLAAIAAAVAAVALIAAPRLGLGADWTREQPATWAKSGPYGRCP